MYLKSRGLLFSPILNEMNPVYNLASSFFKILCNIVLPSKSKSYKFSLSFRFSYHISLSSSVPSVSKTSTVYI